MKKSVLFALPPPNAPDKMPLMNPCSPLVCLGARQNKRTKCALFCAICAPISR
jgi:hypothetical protein